MFYSRCITLRCTTLHCIALHCTVLHCAALHCTARKCSEVLCTALHWNALCCTGLIFSVLQCTSLHFMAKLCTTLHCMAKRCTTLHCSVLEEHPNLRAHMDHYNTAQTVEYNWRLCWSAAVETNERGAWEGEISALSSPRVGTKEVVTPWWLGNDLMWSQ